MKKKLFLVYKESSYLSEEDGIVFTPLWVCSDEKTAMNDVKVLSRHNLCLNPKITYNYQIIDFHDK